MLQVKNVHKEYRTGDLVQRALDDVSLDLRDNEFVAILGPSGSGKTTLLNIIGGLDRYDSGDLIINGVSTKKYKDRDWDSYRNHTIGFIFQSYNLIPHQTILSNVELALTISGISGEEKKRRAKDALTKVGLGEQGHKKPNQLSGGQMQRVAIARALVNNPDIVLADEPTGALDSDTSIQVMDLLQEVAKDRLVVMVTHNPDLAKQYATRIVNLKDGRILSDTNPFISNSNPEKAVHKNLGKASMSLLTSIGLSLNNLMTKKARTFLVSFAGSIGIIGISLILSLSNGVNQYIADIEEQTLSEYPMSITGSSYDMTSMLAGMGMGLTPKGKNSEEKKEISEIGIMGTFLSTIESNDLYSLRQYLESSDSHVSDYTNAIEYNYGLTPYIYHMKGDRYWQINPNDLLAPMGFSADSILSDYININNFARLPREESLYKGQYDVVWGRWPERADECVVVTDPTGSLTDFLFYICGLRDTEHLTEMIQKYADGLSVDTEPDKRDWYYEDFRDVNFKVINPYKFYAYDEAMGIYTDRRGSKEYMLEALSEARNLKVAGIVKPSKTAKVHMITSGIWYTPALTDEMRDEAEKSDIVQAQLAEPDVNILTGKEFGLDDTDFNFADLISVDTEAIKKAFDIDTSKLKPDLSALDDLSNMGGVTDIDINFDELEGVEGLEDLKNINLSDLISIEPSEEMLDLMDLLTTLDVEVNEKALASMAQKLISDYLAYAAGDPTTDYKELPSAIKSFLISEEGRKILTKAVTDAIKSGSSVQPDPKRLQQAIEKVMSGYGEYALENGYTKPEEFPKHLAEYLATDKAKELLRDEEKKLIDEILSDFKLTKEDADRITNDLVIGYQKYAEENSLPNPAKLKSSIENFLHTEAARAVIMDGLTETIDFESLESQLSDILAIYMKGAMKPLQKTLAENMQKVIQSAVQSIMEKVMEGMTRAIVDKVVGSMMNAMSGLQDAFSIDTNAFMQAFTFNLDEKELQSFIKAMMFGTASSLPGNLRSFGYARPEDLNAITIFPIDFESKEAVNDILDKYNADALASGHPERKISYSDMVGAMMSSVVDIIDIISYVLMAFVSISLVVSSIMIGVITYISVLERQKEIGILRAMGASKHNISQVFNAETLITGFLAGLIGVTITDLLLIPGNMIIRSVTGHPNINCKLYLNEAIVLIILSVVLTIIGGLMPSKKAANCDPVTALRTE